VKPFEHVVARANSHHEFFERGVAGAFANAVDGAFDLTRAALHSSECVGDRKAKVIVAMRAEDDVPGAFRTGDDVPEHAFVFGRCGIAGGVGHVDGGRSRLDSGFDDLHEKVQFGA
jgi:hypothetical protein